MRFLASVKVRLFLCSWIFYTIHFGTNVVREHYPAFSLVENQTLQVDRYLPFHPDIFKHTDGHAYIGNNVACSFVAAVPLLIFHPVLNMIEGFEQEQLKKNPPKKVVYKTHHKNSQIFMKLVKEAGLSLRFGASTVVTTAFLMAPLSALILVLMFQILRERGLSERQALWVTLLFGFATPVFFRTGVLNHNMMLMYVTFLAFHLIWVRPGQAAPSSTKNRAIAGALCGFGLALDYSGVIPLLVFFGYLIGARVKSSSWKQSIQESMVFVLGSVPPVLFLLWTQWAMFENPFLPGQFWMPDVHSSAFDPSFKNPYSQMGFRGFTFPTPDLYLLNLFEPTYGLYSYGPLLMVGLVPAWIYTKKGDTNLILPKPERIFVAAYFFAFLTFCSANQYSRIQFNSGFRYMIPLVPLLFLAASDHLVRMPKKLLMLIAIPCLLHSWVIAMVREPVHDSWLFVLKNGPAMPWLTVFKATRVDPPAILLSPVVPIGIFALALGVCYLIWRLGERASTMSKS